MPQEKDEITLAGIARLFRVSSSLYEKELAYIGELAEYLCQMAGDEEIYFRDAQFMENYRLLTARLDKELSDSMPDYNKNRLLSLELARGVHRRVLLCRRFTDLLGIEGVMGAGTFFDDEPDGGDETVSYVRNGYSDAAYGRFTASMAEPRVLYGHDFTEVCENVYYGRTGCCILPLENTADGRLAGFRAMMMKYGLKIIRICRVTTGNEGENTVFALLKKNIVLPVEKKNLYFEFRSSGSLPALLAGAETAGMEVLTVNTAPGDGGAHDILLKVSDEGLCGYLSYLFLEYPDFVPLGIFDDIGKEA